MTTAVLDVSMSNGMQVAEEEHQEASGELMGDACDGCDSCDCCDGCDGCDG